MDRCSTRYPVFALLTLTVLVSLGLLMALLWHLPDEHHSILALCRLAWEELFAHTEARRVLIPFLALLTMTSSGIVLVGRQLRATHRLCVSFQPLLICPPLRVARLARRLGLEGRVDVILSDTPFVFCYGLVTPRICLTTTLANMLEDDELEAVLLHERHHMRSFDPLLIVLCRTLAKSLAFLPVARQFLDHYLVSKELAADRHAIETLGDTAPLASALLKLLARARRPNFGEAPVSALNVTRERIYQILKGEAGQAPQPTLRATVMSLLIVAALFVASYTPLLVSPEQAIFHDSCDPSSTLLVQAHHH